MKSRKKLPGLPPGTVIFTGNQMVEKVAMHYMQYNTNQLTEKELDTHQKFNLLPSKDHQVDWYDIRGLHDTTLIEAMGKVFEIHSLILEDLVDVHNRPKYEEYPKGNFVLLKALSFDSAKSEVAQEHLGLYFREGLVISFQETESDLFEKVRTRIQTGKGKIRGRGADYLAYALIDEIVDHYFIVMDGIEETVESIEDGISAEPGGQIKERIHFLKRELLKVRKSIMPLREAISRFTKSDSPIVKDTSKLYINDLYDHTIQIMDMVDNYRDILNGLQDLYISEISLQMNKVMQVLAVVTTLFVPITFLAGLYGMNFENIPELHYEYGYFILLVVMFVIFVASILYFRAKKWF